MIKKLFSKKWVKTILILIAFGAYWNVGILANYGILCLRYYPHSTVAKIIFPLPISILDRKFADGSFENYYAKEKNTYFSFLRVLLWPLGLVLFGVVSFILWIIWIGIHFWHGLCWIVPWVFSFLFQGGILKTVGFIP
ncbi:hypothetical protein KKA27_00640 [Patescibacteria group bacterium]|nr:hypothetical protein [Patescibacteria group bacterium]